MFPRFSQTTARLTSSVRCWSVVSLMRLLQWKKGLRAAHRSNLGEKCLWAKNYALVYEPANRIIGNKMRSPKMDTLAT